MRITAFVIDINLSCSVKNKKVCQSYYIEVYWWKIFLLKAILREVITIVKVSVFGFWWREYQCSRDCQNSRKSWCCRYCHSGVRDNKSLLVSMLRSYQRNGTRGWYFGVNGDIDGPQPSVVVSEKSKAAGVMIGRAAQGHGFFWN